MTAVVQGSWPTGDAERVARVLVGWTELKVGRKIAKWDKLKTKLAAMVKQTKKEKKRLAIKRQNESPLYNDELEEKEIEKLVAARRKSIERHNGLLADRQWWFMKEGERKGSMLQNPSVSDPSVSDPSVSDPSVSDPSVSDPPAPIAVCIM